MTEIRLLDRFGTICVDPDDGEAALDSHVLSHRRQSKPNRTIDLLPYISKLPQERLRLILVLRFGLGEDPKPMSLAETGKRVGLSKQRVHQLETQALTMLRKVLTRAPEEVVEEIEEICHRRVVR
jgi:DNA-directed RNA polymerase sigma subunit (sigma70/sigma32)